MAILTYYDIEYSSKVSKIFEAEQVVGLSPDEVKKGEELYNRLVEKLEQGEEIDEGLLGAAIGGVAGALVGPAIGKAVCRVLGIQENGTLGKLLTSRLVTTALGVELGK